MTETFETITMFGGPRDGARIQVRPHTRWISVQPLPSETYWYRLLVGPRGERVAVLSSYVPKRGETAK